MSYRKVLCAFPQSMRIPLRFWIYAPSPVALDCTDRYVGHTVLS